jgi:hypothetical protein
MSVPYVKTSGPPEDLEQFARVRGRGFPVLPDPPTNAPFHTQAQPRMSQIDYLNISPVEVTQATNPTYPNPSIFLPPHFRGTTQRQGNQGLFYQGINEQLVRDRPGSSTNNAQFA